LQANCPYPQKPSNPRPCNQALPTKPKISFLLPDLERQLDPRNALFRLDRAIDWSVFEKEFLPFYCTDGRPDLAIRRLVGLLMLKSLRNLSNEEVVRD
jgi:hypothetical protein